MLTPEHNPEGYAATSPLAAAKDLHGQLLLIHGAIDDNVHPQNTTQLRLRAAEGGQAVPDDDLSARAATASPTRPRSSTCAR